MLLADSFGFAYEAVLKMLADRSELAHDNVNSVRDVLCGAAPLSQELRDKVQRLFGFPILEGYGMTELTCTAIMTPMPLAKEG
jgi:acyl-CoA synthetase (AMP-forming)/AMP-acid ligase II